MADMDESYHVPVETLQLVGGFADGRTVPLYRGQARPRCYHVEVPWEPTIHTFGDGPLEYQEVNGSFDQYELLRDESGASRHNERGELLYGLIASWRDGKKVDLPLERPGA